MNVMSSIMIKDIIKGSIFILPEFVKSILNRT